METIFCELPKGNHLCSDYLYSFIVDWVIATRNPTQHNKELPGFTLCYPGSYWLSVGLPIKQDVLW
jgi:hypothetical protein